MRQYKIVRTDQIDQTMATQVEGNIDAISTTQLKKLTPTGRSLASIKKELERGESTLISESPHTPLFVEAENSLKLNLDHAITLANEAVQALVKHFTPAPVVNLFGQIFSEETTDSLPPAVEPEVLPTESMPPEVAPQAAYRYNLEVACPPNLHLRYLPGLVSLAKVPDNDDAITLFHNTAKKEHYWLRGNAFSNNSRKIYYKPQGSICSNLFSFEISLVEESSEIANEALIPVTPTVQIGKRLGLPTKGYFYHFHNKKLIQEFKIQEGSSCFLVTKSYENTLTDEVKIHKLLSHMLLYWRIHGKVIKDQHVLYREEKLTAEELIKAVTDKWLDDNAVKFDPSQAIEKLNEKIENKPISYTVKSGDYLSKIAKNAGITVSTLQKLNPDIKDPSRISIGQVIKLPATSNKKTKSTSNLPAEAPKVMHLQENIHYNYPFPNVGTHHLAIKKHLIDPNIIALNIADTTKVRRLSKKGRDLLKSVEELRTEPYDDQNPDEKLTKYIPDRTTIGYGYLIPKDEWEQYKDGISAEKATELFNNKIKPYEMTVDTTLRYHVSQQQFDAAVIMAYNIGKKAFKNSSTAKLINDPSAKTIYDDLNSAWLAFSKVTKTDKKTGKKIKVTIDGLLNRRKCELNIFNKGIYKRW